MLQSVGRCQPKQDTLRVTSTLEDWSECMRHASASVTRLMLITAWACRGRSGGRKGSAGSREPRGPRTLGRSCSAGDRGLRETCQAGSSLSARPPQVTLSLHNVKCVNVTATVSPDLFAFMLLLHHAAYVAVTGMFHKNSIHILDACEGSPGRHSSCSNVIDPRYAAPDCPLRRGAQLEYLPCRAAVAKEPACNSHEAIPVPETHATCR